VKASETKSFPALYTDPVRAYPLSGRVIPVSATVFGDSMIPSQVPVPLVVIVSPLKLNDTLSVGLLSFWIERDPVVENTVLPVADVPEKTTEPVDERVSNGTAISITLGIRNDRMEEL